MPVPFSDVLALPQEIPDAVSMYGEASRQFGELWVPGESEEAPVVVLIHGGCWQNAFGIDHARPMAAALSEEGYLVWAIEYRRIGDPGGGWPGTFTDVAAAIDHLPVMLENAGITAGKTIFMGHSAGGQLAL